MKIDSENFTLRFTFRTLPFGFEEWLNHGIDTFKDCGFVVKMSKSIHCLDNQPPLYAFCVKGLKVNKFDYKDSQEK